MLQTLEEMKMFVETIEKSKLSTNILENRAYFKDIIYDENQTAKFSIRVSRTPGKVSNFGTMTANL